MVQDKETVRQLRKAKFFQQLVSNPEWEGMKQEVIEIMKGRLTLSSLDLDKSPEEIKIQAKVNTEISAILYNLLLGVETKARFTVPLTKVNDYVIRSVDYKDR